jgi:hypothetical protein
MIDEVMFEIREMTGQVYKNVYAGKSSDSSTPVATIVDPSSTDASEPEYESTAASSTERNGSVSTLH